MNKTDLISLQKIEKAIYVIRGEKVMLDRDLANLYGVSTAATKSGGAAQSRAVS